RRGDITRTGDKQRYYLHLHYDLRGVERDKMIIKLYTGRYSRDVPDIDKIAVSVNLLLRAFGRTRTA
ncbi:Curdlan synthase, partial [Sinorhizobium meliloti]